MERLRVVFILIVVVTGVAVLMALWQLMILGNAQSNLLERSVPVLVRTQLVERSLHDLVISLRQIEEAPNQDDLVAIGRNVNEQFSSARLSVAGLGRTLGNAEQTNKILRQLSEMESGIQTNLSIKRSLFRSEEMLERFLIVHAQQIEKIRIVTEQLSFDASQKMDARVANIFAYGSEDADAFIAQLGEETRQVGLIAQLALELETIANVVGQLGETTSIEKLNDARDFLGFRMRGALQLAIQLPASPEREKLSKLIGQFRQTIFGSDGELNEIEQFAARSRDLAKQNSSGQILVRNITAATERLMASAHGQLVQAGHLTQATTQRLILILAIAAIVVAIIVMLTILVIVERQINQRIGLLTGSVLRIAAGDTDHETEVTGQDELGKMADALDTFKRNAKELLRSNSELEKFAYAAAHDLRSPLQAIHDLAVWTIEDEDNELSKDSAENLSLLQARVNRLSALLGDLLQYARIGADQSGTSPLDLNELVLETAAMVDPAGAFEISHDWCGAEIETYLNPLQKVLINLMGNTLKHHQAGKGHIHISSSIRNDRLWIEYTDDGPGIPPEYHTKVFELFQTLKPRDEMEGSGLGLAITQKLVEHFEGTVAIKSDPEKHAGTTFIFDFPFKDARLIAEAA